MSGASGGAVEGGGYGRLGGDLRRDRADGGGGRHPGRPRLGHPGGAVLLLHRRRDVADPRRLHDVRGRRGEAQEHHVDGDEEHPHHRRRHAVLLLLRLVHLRLLRAGRPRRGPCGPRRQRLLRRDVAVGRPARPEPRRQHQPRLLPRLPALLLDDRLDHVGGAHRARPALRVPVPDRPARLGGVDHGRRLGLELRRVARHEVRLPRLDRVPRRPRRRGSVHARCAAQPRPEDRQVRLGGQSPKLQTPQHPHDVIGADADLHRVLRLLRRLSRDHLDGVSGLAQHLPVADDARHDRDGDHIRLRRRLHRAAGSRARATRSGRCRAASRE